jgi:1-acyl-sn-glycerol-3-phosphate acyltransferase
MRAVSSIALWTWVWILGCFLSVLALVLFVPFNPLVDRRRRVISWVNGLWGKGVLAALPLLQLEVNGLDTLREAQEPYLIFANHNSVSDIIMILAVWSQLKFVTKRPIFFFPPLFINVRLAGYIQAAKGEEGGAERVLAECLRWLNRGCHVLVFPEGTRSTDGRTLRFRQGPFVMAQQAGVKILPLALSGTHRCIPKGSLWYDLRGRITLDFLEPLSPEGEPKAVASLTRQRIQAALDRRGPPESPEGWPPPAARQPALLKPR